MKLSMQKGFTLVEGLLIVLVIAVIGFGGFYAYNQAQENSEQTDSTNQSQQEEVADISEEQDIVLEEDSVTSDVASERSADWVSFSPDSGVYTMKLADGWEFTHQNDECDCLLSKSAVYKQGTPARIETSQGGRGGGYGLFISVDDSDMSSERFSSSDLVTDSFQTEDLVGAEYYREITDSMVVAVDTRSHEFYFPHNGRFIYVAYVEDPSEDSNIDIVREMIQTLETGE